MLISSSQIQTLRELDEKRRQRIMNDANTDTSLVSNDKAVASKLEFMVHDEGNFINLTMTNDDIFHCQLRDINGNLIASFSNESAFIAIDGCHKLFRLKTISEEDVLSAVERASMSEPDQGIVCMVFTTKSFRFNLEEALCQSFGLDEIQSILEKNPKIVRLNDGNQWLRLYGDYKKYTDT